MKYKEIEIGDELFVQWDDASYLVKVVRKDDRAIEGNYKTFSSQNFGEFCGDFMKEGRFPKKKCKFSKEKM